MEVTWEYTFEELKDFINSQDDDKVLDMDDPCLSTQGCGCLLVQFGNKLVKDNGWKNVNAVGYSAIGCVGDNNENFVITTNSAWVGELVSELIEKQKDKCNYLTYKDVKRTLNEVDK